MWIVYSICVWVHPHSQPEGTNLYAVIEYVPQVKLIE